MKSRGVMIPAVLILCLSMGCTHKFVPRNTVSVQVSTPLDTASIAVLPSLEFESALMVEERLFPRSSYLGYDKYRAGLADAVCGAIAYSLSDVYADVILIPPERRAKTMLPVTQHRLFLKKAIWDNRTHARTLLDPYQMELQVDIIYQKSATSPPEYIRVTGYGEGREGFGKRLGALFMSGMINRDLAYNSTLETFKEAMNNTVANAAKEVTREVKARKQSGAPPVR